MARRSRSSKATSAAFRAARPRRLRATVRRGECINMMHSTPRIRNKGLRTRRLSGAQSDLHPAHGGWNHRHRHPQGLHPPQHPPRCLAHTRATAIPLTVTRQLQRDAKRERIRHECFCETGRSDVRRCCSARAPCRCVSAGGRAVGDATSECFVHGTLDMKQP
jgi:hypothetical protein